MLSLSEWDSQIACFINESLKYNSQEYMLEFISKFLDEGIKVN